MWKFTQRSWVGGRLDAELRGRQDLSKYFQGASELVNFTVRRQGLLSKRRGTSLIAKLKGLFTTTTTDAESGETTTTENPIISARLIPLLYERDQGYAILFASDGATTKAFRVSSTGIDAENGIVVPYDSNAVAEFNYAQSGDTVFIAHRNYAPAKILHSNGKLTYEVISFNETTWQPPVILSCVKDSVDGTGASATCSYVATYVKDGIESAPSSEFQMTYKTPWVSGGVVTITCDKGANETEPDYYNIYKKDAGLYFGIIAVSTGGRQEILTPTVTGAEGMPRCTGRYLGYYTETLKTTNISETLNQSPRDPAETKVYETYYSSDYWGGKCYGYVIEGIGGMKVSNSTLFDFGENAGSIVSKITIGLDSFGFYVFTDADSFSHFYLVYTKGTALVYKCKVTTRTIPTDGTEGEVVVINPSEYTCLIVSVADSEQDSGNVYLCTRYYGSPEIDYNYSTNLQKALTKAGAGKRTLTIDFAAALKGKFAKGGSYKTNAKGVAIINKEDVNFAVTKIEITGYATAEDTTAAPFYFNSVRFDNAYGKTNILQDTYLTPDLSLTPPVNETHFSSLGEYPACVALDQQRLVFASSKNEPAKYWFSCVGDLYNFNMHDTVREDDAIAAELAATEFPNINHIIVGRDLLLLTEGGEWLIAPVSGNTLSYKTISSKLQSAYGCSETVKPILIGDEIVFLNRTGETLRATRYNYTSDGYESTDLSVLSQWITKNNPMKELSYRQSPDSTVECILEDGTIAALVYMKEHEVCAWGRYILPNGYSYHSIACTQAVSNGSSEMLYLVEKDGEWELWRERDDMPIRDETSGVDPTQHLCLDRLRELGTGEEPLEGEYTFTTADGKTYAGFPFTAILETMPPEPQGSDGTIQMEIKNAKDAEVRVLQSGDFTMRSVTVPDAYKVAGGVDATLKDGRLYLVSKDVRKLLAGRNGGDGRFHLESTTPFPLNILSLSIDYEIQPLSGSEG